MKGKIYLLITSFLFSCGAPEQKEAPTTSEVKIDSVKTSSESVIPKEDFTSVLKGITISNLNQYIHPTNGLWIIESPGALPAMRNVKNIEGKFPLDFSNIIVDDNLPSIDCDAKNFWTKDGCFLQETNTFKDEKIWTYSGLTKEDEAKVFELAQTISWTTINTSLNASYYFTEIDGKWYLTFVDLRTPCSA